MKTLKILTFVAAVLISNFALNAQDLSKEVRTLPEKKTFVGIHAGAGYGLYSILEEFYLEGEGGSEYFSSSYETYGYNSGNIGIDVAIPVTKLFYIGPYASVGKDLETLVVGAGVTMMFNFRNKSALMASYGVNIYGDPDVLVGSSSRLSYKFPKRLYLGLEAMETSSTWTYDGMNAGDVTVFGIDHSISVLFHVGFRLF